MSVSLSARTMLACLLRPLVFGVIVGAGVYLWYSSDSGIDAMTALYQLKHECAWENPMLKAVAAGFVAFVFASCMSKDVQSKMAASMALSDYDLMDTRT